MGRRTAYTTYNGTTHLQDDLVEYNGSVYIALADNTGSMPPAPAAAPSANWELFARAGDMQLAAIANWNAATAYVGGEFVEFLGSTWYAKAASTNVVPDIADPPTEWWLIASKGDPGIQGAAGTAGTDGGASQAFRQDGVAVEAVGSEFWPAPFDLLVDDVVCTSMDPPFSTDVQMDILANGVSIFGGTGPLVPVGEVVGAALVPAVPLIGRGQLVSADMVQVGPETGDPLVMGLAGTAGQYNSNAGAPSSWYIPIPSGYAVGGLLVCFCYSLAGSVTGLPTGWARFTGVSDVVDASASNHMAVFCKIAASGESATQSVTMTGLGPVTAICVCVTNPLGADDLDDHDSGLVDSPVANHLTIPQMTSSTTDELGLWCWGRRSNIRSERRHPFGAFGPNGRGGLLHEPRQRDPHERLHPLVLQAASYRHQLRLLRLHGDPEHQMGRDRAHREERHHRRVPRSQRDRPY